MPDGENLKVIKHGYLSCGWSEPILKMFTVCNYEDEDWDYDNAPCALEHPFIANRILTSPAVSEVLIENGKIPVDSVVTNANGITVYDALIKLAGM